MSLREGDMAHTSVADIYSGDCNGFTSSPHPGARESYGHIAVLSYPMIQCVGNLLYLPFIQLLIKFQAG